MEEDQLTLLYAIKVHCSATLFLLFPNDKEYNVYIELTVILSRKKTIMHADTCVDQF